MTGTPDLAGPRLGHAPQTLAGFAPLSPAEQMLVDGLSEGRFDRIGGGGAPQPDDPRRAVRAGLLRMLMLGAPDAPRMHEKGLRVSGAAVIGQLDLEGCRIAGDLGLVDCLFDHPLVLRAAVIGTLFLDGSTLPGLVAERLQARGDLLLRDTTVDGQVALPGARLGGGLVLDHARIANPGDVALNARNLDVHGDVLARGAAIEGAAVLSGAHIEGVVDAAGAVFRQPEGTALNADMAVIDGGVRLRHVRMQGALAMDDLRCNGRLDLSGGTFENPGDTALGLSNTEIRGAFVLRDGARVAGLLDLRGAALGSMMDDPASWPGPGDLALDRCRYGAFLGATTLARTRLAWLALQVPARWGEDFWPQPYEQLAGVLGDMGHDEEARRVLFQKERLQRRARRARERSRVIRAALWLRDGFLRITVGYGRRSLLALLWLAALWISGAGALAVAYDARAMRPNMPFVLRTPEWVQCGVQEAGEVWIPSAQEARPGLAARGQSQLGCYLEQPEAVAYPAFNAWMYAVDTLLPAIDTGQRDFWAPDTRTPTGVAAKVVVYALTLSGWVLSLLAVAGFSGLVRSR